MERPARFRLYGFFETVFHLQFHSSITLFPFLTDSVSETESPGSDRYGVTVSVTDSIILDTD